jgi:hypothetical protein
MFLWSDRNAQSQVRSSAPFPKTKRASFSVFVCGPDCLLYFREFPRWTSRHNLFDDFRMRQQIIRKRGPVAFTTGTPTAKGT